MDSKKTLEDVNMLIGLARQYKEAGEVTMSVGTEFLHRVLTAVKPCLKVEVELEGRNDD